jgi:uncharacterized membrane protein YbhN (UPF0104 family)
MTWDARIPHLVGSAFDRVEALDARFLAAALALQLIALCCKSVAWRNVLAASYPDERVSTFSIGCSYAAGMALNGFVPARAGEAAKVALARTQIAGSAVPTIVATLAVLAFFDALVGVTLVAVLWLAGVIPVFPMPSLATGLPFALAITVAGIAVALFEHLKPGILRGLLLRAVRGFAVLRTPRRYFRSVVPFQLTAWACRIGVVYLVLGAFGIHTGIETVLLLVVLGGLATALPVPGGVGAQQLLAAYALQGIVSAANAVSFAIGLQVGITVVNTIIGIAGAMILFRTLRPLEAVRAARSARLAP